MLRPPWLVWMTCRRDGLTHAVSNKQLRITIRTHCVVYRAICDHRAFPVPAGGPVGAYCVHCQALSRPLGGLLTAGHRTGFIWD